METCEHKWEHDDGILRAYIHVAVTSEEPRYYPPQGLVKVEICRWCHLIRLPFEEKIE